MKALQDWSTSHGALSPVLTVVVMQNEIPHNINCSAAKIVRQLQGNDEVSLGRVCFPRELG